MIKKAVLLLLLAIVINAVLLVFICAHHTFVIGLNPFLNIVLGVLLLLIFALVLIFAFRWTARQSLQLTPAKAFIFGIFVLLIEDLINTVETGNSTFDIQLHDTLFVFAHVYLVIFFALLFLAFAAIYFLFPKITGKTVNAQMGYIHFAFTLIAAYFICWSSHYSGLAGMPRRYIDYRNSLSLIQFPGLGQIAMLVAILLVCGQIIFLANLVWSAVKSYNK